MNADASGLLSILYVPLMRLPVFRGFIMVVMEYVTGSAASLAFISSDRGGNVSVIMDASQLFLLCVCVILFVAHIR